MRKEIRNIRDVWLEGYQRLLEQAMANGTVSLHPEHRERRRHPRFVVPLEDIGTPGDGLLAVQDLSWSGICFDSGNAYFSQRGLTLELANVFSTEAEVVSCDRQPAPGAAAPLYRVRCRFKDEEHGLQFLTLALELYHVERD